MRYSTEPKTYAYDSTLKLSMVHGKTLVSQVFPSAESVLINSKEFASMEQAMASVSILCSELIVALNKAVKAERYGVLSELNPNKFDHDALTDNWEPNELAKIWVVDKIEQKRATDGIRAVGLTRVREIEGETVSLN